MADGGEFGYNDPELGKKLDHDDDDEEEEQEEEVHRTLPFQPPEASTPYHGGEQVEMQTMQHELSGLPNTSDVETPLLGDFLNPEDQKSWIENAKEKIRDRFLNANFRKMPPIGFSKKGNRSELVVFKKDGKVERILYKKAGRDGESSIFKKIIDSFKTELGDEPEKILEETKKEAAALEKQAKNKEKAQAEVDKIKARLAKKESERNTIEERLNSTKDLDDLKEHESKMQRQNAEDQAIIQDEKALPSDIEAARERVEERNEELARLQTRIKERERTRPLLERVKDMFKKYGVTVTAIILAAGVTIGDFVSSITNSLKDTGKALGKGLQDIGAKLASLLPGLIGSIASFLFKAAGQAIGFLAEHTWLLILALVAFLFEKYLKKRR